MCAALLVEKRTMNGIPQRNNAKVDLEYQKRNRDAPGKKDEEKRKKKRGTGLLSRSENKTGPFLGMHNTATGCKREGIEEKE